ncbi:hypothetical protein DRE_07210 [Drechslerella stenobrocha 248]|uniref:TOG domain-containing protein n=1 Tax=Drechslerella stenobrocha 248 TaxID=1043628 RepID=W7I5T1_9PEZI|nr:hypothetical protein DRE_07210 [Drechslerella stenobrocha 248]
MADQEDDYSTLPLTDRATHKVWKVRKQAYEETTKEFEKSGSESDACFRPWLNDSSLWKGIVADSNVAAQQEGINCLHAFLQFGGSNASLRSRPHTIAPLVEKGLVSSKASTKLKTIDVLLLYIELDIPAPVVDELLPFLSHKMPKIVAATTNALCTIYREFGTKTVDPKPVLKQLPKLFAHGDKNVRAEAVNLTVEFYRWLKDGIKPIFFNELKPVQQKELDEAFEKVKGDSPKQSRLLRSQQVALAEASDTGNGDDADGELDGEPDTFDLFEPVDILNKIPKDFWDQVNSTKWKDRKESLELLHGIVKVPRIKEEDFSEVARILAKSMKDANVTVVIVAANCVECLAKGLRTGFARYRPIIFVPTAERLKEKKQAVADALAAALDAMFGSTSLSDIIEDTIELLKSKNPQVKLESLKFLNRCLKETRVAPSKPEVKLISDTVTRLLTDTLEATRTAAAESMGTLMKIMGERAMNPFLDGLDDIRKSKIKEFFETAQVKAKDKPPAPVASAPPSSTSRLQVKKKIGAKAPGTQAQSSRPTAPGATRGVAEEASSPAKRVPSGIKPTGSKQLASKPGKKLPPALASPTRSTTQVEDNASHNTPAPSKFGLGTRGGLTSRTLQVPQANGKAQETPRPPELGSSSADRVELENLRLEKENWVTEAVSHRAEKDKLLQELNNIKLKTAQENLEKKQREIDRLKRELARFSRASSPAGAELMDTLTQDTFGGYPRDRTASASGILASSEHSRGIGAASRTRNRSSLANPSYNIEDSMGIYSNRELIRSPISESGSSGRERVQQTADGDVRPGDTPDPNENWKRAAQVTSQLKMRIEQMKARQHMRGVS